MSSYRISTEFEYHVHRRPSFLHRIRRSLWHFYRDSRSTAGMIILATIVGTGIFATLEWYSRFLDGGINAAVDSEYRSFGVEPTGDRSEDAEFRNKVSDYKEFQKYKADRAANGGGDP